MEGMNNSISSIVSFENELFQVCISPVGGEICSFSSKKSGIEYIWRGDDEVWGSTAPVLFPIIGVLKDGYCLFEGEKYSIPKHGFIRNSSNLVIENQTSNSLHFSLSSSDQTKVMFPFDFRFHIKFKLLNSTLSISHKIENLSKDKPMFFSLGAHPAFNCPFDREDNYSDYFIEFDQVESAQRCCVLPDGTIGIDKEPLIDNTNVVLLNHDLFKKDALIFKDLKSRKVFLKSKKNNNSVEVQFQDFEYLGIWAKTNGDFVCIEPWLGISDSCLTNHELQEKEGIIRLEANSQYRASYTIKINEGA